MTKQELSNRVWMKKTGAGHFRIGIDYYGKTIGYTETDMDVIDCAQDEDGGHWYTQKQALQTLWSRCVSKNRI